MGNVIKHHWNTTVTGGLVTAVLNEPISANDENANEFSVSVQNADFESATCQGFFIRGDGMTIILDGQVSGKTASVVLAPNCYNVTGRFTITVKVTKGESTTSWLRVEGYVKATSTDDYAFAGDDSAPLDLLLEAAENVDEVIERAEAAITEANEAAVIANEAASDADEARMNIQSDLAQKAPAIFVDASGEIVTITDGAAMPVQSLVSHIEPVQSGSGDPSPDNVRAISGWDAVTATRAVKNQIDEAAMVNGSYIDSFGNVNENENYRYSPAFLTVKPGQDYVLQINKITSEERAFSVCLYDKDKNFIERITPISTGSTGVLTAAIMIPGNIYYIRYSAPVEEQADHLQLEFGTTATAYEPYQGQTLTADLQETVYGGTLDWTTGVLLTDGLLIDAGTLNWSYWYGNMFYAPTNIYINDVLCDIYPPGSLAANGVFLREEARGTIYIRDTSLTDGAAGAAELKQKLSGHKIFYKKEFPVEYQLTPQQLETLKGTNNIWSDAGATEVTYAVDTKMYADGKDSKTMIAPVEHGMVASRNYNIGDLLVAQNTLYRATVAIANGETIVPGSNCKETTVSENLGGGGGSGGNYVLPIASADTLGGVKVGDGLQMDGDALGVVKKEYELLQNTYVEVDDLAIIRLSDIMLQKILVSVDSGNVRSAFSARTIIRAGTKDIFNTADAVCADSKRQITKYYIAKQDGLVDIKALTPTAPGGLSDVKMYSDEVKSIDDITRITVTPSVSGTYFPRGLTVQVWGVRA